MPAVLEHDDERTRSLEFIVVIDAKGGIDHIRVDSRTRGAFAGGGHSLSDHPLGKIQITRIDVYTFTDQSQGHSYGEEITTDAPTGSTLTHIIRNRPVESISLKSREMRDAIHQCVQKCLSKHKHCQRIKCAPLLPSRILQVSPCQEPDSQVRQPVKLHISLPDERAEYIALSYCWGGPQPVLATRENLSRHQQGFDTSCFPQTIRDAIAVTRGLKIRYLWVDVLCILQDLGDKTHEIQRMGDIYKNATVTIATARSPTVIGGFLNQYLCSNAIETRLNDSGSFEKVGSYLKRHMISTTNLCHGEDGHSKNKYCHHEYFISAQKASRGTGVSRSFPKMADFLDSRYVVEQWQQLVEDYCMRDLSFAKDKLLAIVGVAAEFHNIYPDTYLAGLWKCEIVRHLAWSRDEADYFAPLSMAKGFCDAPTWSWASTSCRIAFVSMDKCNARFVGATIQPRFVYSPFGDVRGKTLVLSAKMTPISHIYWSFNIHLDKPHSNWTLFYMDQSTLSDRLSRDPTNIWFMLLGYVGSKWKLPVGLILAESGAAFQRIGFLEHSYLNSSFPDDLATEIDHIRMLGVVSWAQRSRVEII
ncbi:uncharacterized protein PAC_03961 [Phialocephala subalpina]|uniref:Heterokaryon incompatibility domain-containing protein n=1 Tax=Phialocephala subalpina TaxID=576137 RepID=A0A1L7WMV8_9HELO|nr:uncharacterized protein PAC_03961 [Phialocephala subalpina]